MKHTVDKYFFPGFVKKCITFSIDDGYLEMDKKFIDIVKPAGILGDFNLVGNRLDLNDPQKYLDLYEGFGVANHVSFHPFCMDPEKTYTVADEPFDAATADPEKIYPTENEGLYRFHRPNGWRLICSREKYISLVKDGKERIEAVFGKGSCRGFVWPYSKQKDEELQREIEKLGYTELRNSPQIGDTTDFAFPADRTCWYLNTAHKVLIDCANAFEKYENPEGRLCFFSFGIHSVDYEREGTWDLLHELADRFGNRPETYYSGTVEHLFDYQDAIEALDITGDVLNNDSDLDLYLTVDGERKVLRAHSSLTLS